MGQRTDRIFGAKPGVPRKPARNPIETAQRKSQWTLEGSIIRYPILTRSQIIWIKASPRHTGSHNDFREKE
jgi:hypothetical protein